jgi:hypothetical protein
MFCILICGNDFEDSNDPSLSNEFNSSTFSPFEKEINNFESSELISIAVISCLAWSVFSQIIVKLIILKNGKEDFCFSYFIRSNTLKIPLLEPQINQGLLLKVANEVISSSRHLNSYS